jgi:glycosyltransferase involved in cell wall biosynthesis
MGYYPISPRGAAKVIHDYRSLSTPPLKQLKDCFKRYTQPRPDARIFLSKALKETLGFPEDHNNYIIPMGIPEGILQYRHQQNSKFTFSYVGQINKTRKMDLVIESFLKHYPSETIALAGHTEHKILQKYKEYNNVTFFGVTTQSKCFELVSKSNISICPLPDITPFNVQTPTKLLEFAALGKPIVASKTDSIQRIAEEFQLNVMYSPSIDDFFGSVSIKTIKNNIQFDPNTLYWGDIIQRSGISSFLEK